MNQVNKSMVSFIVGMFILWAGWVSTTVVAQSAQLASNDATIQQVDKKLDDVKALLIMLLEERGIPCASPPCKVN
jgi:hypothetical protein